MTTPRTAEARRRIRRIVTTAVGERVEFVGSLPEARRDAAHLDGKIGVFRVLHPRGI